MTKNIRISLYILIPTIFWMLSGFFFTEEKDEIIENKKLFREAVMPNRYWLVLSQLSFYPLSGGLYMLSLNTASSQKWPSET